MSVTAVLFDIDGTLLHDAGAGRRAFAAALAREWGEAAREALGKVRFDGKTDRLILREVSLLADQAAEAIDAARLLEVYLEALHGELARAQIEVLPGVVALLEELSSRNVLVGLITGNVERGARAKLEAAKLDHHFSFGGFGDDGEAREEVVHAALARARARAGFPPAQTWVLGDTPRDVEAARAHGCRTLGVATGRFSASELVEARADAVFANLADPGVLEVLLGETG